MNTEPAKSKSFKLVVNQLAVEGGKSKDARGGDSEDGGGGAALGPHSFGERNVLVKSGMEANPMKPLVENSETDGVVVGHDEKEEHEDKEEREKQSRSIVSVRLGEEGSRFSFAKVLSFSVSSTLYRVVMRNSEGEKMT